MKTTDLFQPILLFALFLCGLAACNNDDDLRLSPMQETTMDGDASTLQIDLTRSNWRIASITTLGGTTMVDTNNRPLQLEGLGSLHFRWFDLTRENETQLTLKTEDNFDGEERGLILNLEMKTGFYKEQITIRQAPCENFYQIESIEYSVGWKKPGRNPTRVPIKMKLWATQPESMTIIRSSTNGQNTHSCSTTTPTMSSTG